eukprot:303949-Pleurochrysis_carterae.AAC.1
MNRANAAARGANKENATAVSELEAQVQRLNEGRIWARIRTEETKRMQAEEACRVLQEQVDQQANELSSRSQNAAKERQELANLRFRCKEYVGRKLPGALQPQVLRREPMAAGIEELKAENQRLRDEITELKGFTEPGKKYFHDDGFTLA